MPGLRRASTSYVSLREPRLDAVRLRDVLRSAEKFMRAIPRASPRYPECCN